MVTGKVFLEARLDQAFREGLLPSREPQGRRDIRIFRPERFEGQGTGLGPKREEVVAQPPMKTRSPRYGSSASTARAKD
jgi:hypothetical protein